MAEKINARLEVTREMMIKALYEPHRLCDGDCIHAKALESCIRDLEKITLTAMLGSSPLPPVLAILVEGIHVGFALREFYDLELQKQKIQ